jgi:hypothetical protein
MLSVLLLDLNEHKVRVTPPLIVETPRMAQLQTAAAPSSVEALGWELFTLVADTTKTRHMSQMLSALVVSMSTRCVSHRHLQSKRLAQPTFKPLELHQTSRRSAGSFSNLSTFQF